MIILLLAVVAAFVSGFGIGAILAIKKMDDSWESAFDIGYESGKRHIHVSEICKTVDARVGQFRDRAVR